MKRYLRRLLGLPFREWLPLFATALLLTAIAAGLRLFGFKRVYRQLAGLDGAEALPLDGEEERERVARTAQRVRRAAAPLPYATCLSRSLALWWLLLRQGIYSELRVGVRKNEGNFEAHAWVEHGGQVLSDRHQIATRFVAFNRSLLSSEWDRVN